MQNEEGKVFRVEQIAKNQTIIDRKRERIVKSLMKYSQSMQENRVMRTKIKH